MAKYKEVHDKQRQLEEMADRDEQMGKGLFVGFTFRYVFQGNILGLSLTWVDIASQPWKMVEQVLGSLFLQRAPLARSFNFLSVYG